MSIDVRQGDSREVLAGFVDNSIDSCVTDPPYSLVSIQKRFGKPGQAGAQFGKDGLYQRASSGFMGQTWDTGETAHDPAFWAEVLRVLKPGAHLVAFGGTRTFHRMVCSIEDAGFEIRDQIGWAFGSGFPKSHDVSKGIDRNHHAKREVIGRRKVNRGLPFTSEGPSELDVTVPASDEVRQWEGWGTALKPAWEPICLARKPLSEKTVAANVLRWGTGTLNIDGCRVRFDSNGDRDAAKPGGRATGKPLSRLSGKDDERKAFVASDNSAGRWPANLCHDGSEEVLAAFPEPHGAGHGDYMKDRADYNASSYHIPGGSLFRVGDSGSAARFFYSAKADATDRWGSKHPTVKPVDLMRWLARLVTPPRGLVLDPFAGSGSTGIACIAEGFDCILIEREDAYIADIRERVAYYSGEGKHSLASKNRKSAKPGAAETPLFGDIDAETT